MNKRTILNDEEKKEVMKQMNSNAKADFVEVIMEMKKNNEGVTNGNTKSN